MRNVKHPNNSRHQNDVMTSTFKITTWNAIGLTKYLQENFIFSQNINILFDFKIHFTNKSYFRIPAYILYYTM